MTALFSKKKICSSRSLPEKLRIARKKMDINLEEAEKETKIPMKYLHALEHAEYNNLPADIYVLGFLKRYGNFLGMKQDIVKQYRDEKAIACSVSNLKNKFIKEEKKTLIRPEPSMKWLNSPRFFLTPELVISVCVTIAVVGLLGYIWFQVKSFAAAPPLELSNNNAEIVVSMDSINIEGKTDSGAILTINNEPVGVSADGSFSQQIQLSKGVNTIQILARNKANKETEKTIQILNK